MDTFAACSCGGLYVFSHAHGLCVGLYAAMRDWTFYFLWGHKPGSLAFMTFYMQVGVCPRLQQMGPLKHERLLTTDRLVFVLWPRVWCS